MDGHASRVARADVAPGPITAGEPIETGEVVTDQIRPQSFPLPKGHAFYHYFYYREDPDGLELESTMSGEVEFLGFCSSITEVRRAIMKYLYKRGNTEELVKSIWPKSDLV
jgi:sarcosine oxidase delta subunit